jgi:endonuclease/exonuclease/phosphatase (EEP) superfamily protein YafD
MTSRVDGAMRFPALLFVLPFLSSCFSITVDPRALMLRPDGAVEVRLLRCADVDWPPRAQVANASETLDPRAIRLITWNIHKEGDTGWERDLSRFAQAYDIVLLQEVTLRSSLRRIVEAENLRWIMASSFLYGGDDIGVLTAARVAPIASCTQRVVEPLIRLPKSAVIIWFRLPDTVQTLAVVNVHAINFSLSLEAYRAQFTALGDALAAHEGPIILAGDLNTWTEDRSQAVSETAARLGLVEITFAADKRSLFFGKQLDHIFIRGLEMIESSAIPVTSSDHNPVAATLRVLSH